MISRDSGDPISSPGSLKTMRKVFSPDRSSIVLLDSGGLFSVHAVRNIRIETMSIPPLFLMLIPDVMLTWVELNQFPGLLIDQILFWTNSKWGQRPLFVFEQSHIGS